MARLTEPDLLIHAPNLVLPTFGGKQLWADELIYAGYRIQANVVTRAYRLLDPNDVRLAWGTFDRCKSTLDRLRESRNIQPSSSHLVLCLHGIFRSKDSFSPIVKGLRKAGFDAHAVNYPSTRLRIEVHADQIEELLENAEGATEVSFVTHSMGGLVARYLLDRDSAWRKRITVRRLLMLAPPNQGAHMAHLLEPLTAFRAAAGPAAHQLTPAGAREIPIPRDEFAIIAGVRGDPAGYNPLLDGDDDMTVELSSTYLKGAVDHWSIPTTHTLILFNPSVVQASVRYLSSGHLRPTNDADADDTP